MTYPILFVSFESGNTRANRTGARAISFHGQITDTADAQRTAPPPRTLPVYDARRLTDSDGTAMIVLDDKTYQLRITRAGKLILTK